MPEAQSQVDIGHGTIIRIGRGGGPTWTEIMGAEQAAVPSQPPEDTDVTHLRSPSRTRETKPGMKPVADYGLELQYWPGSATDVLLTELADLTAAGTPETIIYEITPNGGATWQFSAYVNTYVPSSPVGDKQMVAVNLKVSARIIAEAAPTNTLAPAVSGTAQVGQTVTVLEGEWTGVPTFTYQWQELDGTWGNISGATSKTYVVGAGVEGNPIRCVVTGTNDEGSANANSSATADVIAA